MDIGIYEIALNEETLEYILYEQLTCKELVFGDLKDVLIYIKADLEETEESILEAL